MNASDGKHLRAITPATWITLGRFALVPVCAMAISRGAFGWAWVLFAVAAASDALDGIVARLFNQRSRLGATLDPLADKALLIASMVALTFGLRVPHPLSPVVTLPALTRDGLILAGALAIAVRHGWPHFRPHWTSKCNTAALLVTVLITLGVNWRYAEGAPVWLARVETTAWAVCLCLIFLSAIAYAWRGAGEFMKGPPAQADS